MATAVVVAFGLLCLAGVSPARGDETPEISLQSQRNQMLPDSKETEPVPLVVFGDEPNPDINATETNKVPHQPRSLLRLVHNTLFAHPIAKRSADETIQGDHDSHDQSKNPHDHDHDQSKGPKDRKKRFLTCSKCGASRPSYGGGGGGCQTGNCGGGGGRPIYIGGGGGGGCGYGGCGGGGGGRIPYQGGGGCSGGGCGQPVYSQPIYQRPVYQQPSVCSVCGQPIGGGGYGQSYSQSYSSSSSSSNGYGRK